MRSFITLIMVGICLLTNLYFLYSFHQLKKENSEIPNFVEAMVFKVSAKDFNDSLIKKVQREMDNFDGGNVRRFPVNNFEEFQKLLHTYGTEATMVEIFIQSKDTCVYYTNALPTERLKHFLAMKDKKAKVFVTVNPSQFF